MKERLKQVFLGKQKDPFSKKTRSNIALTAFLAWVGLGADGLSSSCYGPAVSYLALGEHHELAFYLAIATAVTVFIISFAYNQVIRLFPNGGGGYKVATELLGVNFGLVAGAALLIDYCLTIVISVASGAEALFSLFPYSYSVWKLKFEIAIVLLLVYLNLRGIKEAIKVLLPIFLGFVVTHIFMITYGMVRHGERLPLLFNQAISGSYRLVLENGTLFVAALFLHAYSMGGGTYTGLEAVSNNVNVLKEPKERTGKWTMFFMAFSLSITAGGIITLYLLWQVQPQPGQSLNAVAFRALTDNLRFSEPIVIITLLFEFGLLFVGANTGFLGGPAVLSNMAMHRWVPRQFLHLSSRLVVQNGVILFGLAAILLLILTRGHIQLLIILYSSNVFLAFAISILGLCRYWVTERPLGWIRPLLLSFIAFILCFSILVIILLSQFFNGGLEAILLTLAIIFPCLWIRLHYRKIQQKLYEADKTLLDIPIKEQKTALKPLDYNAPTAVFFIGRSRGVGMHALLWVQRLFPGIFKNFVFVRVGEVDIESFSAPKQLSLMQAKVTMSLSFFANFARSNGLAYKTYEDYSIDPVDSSVKLADKIKEDFPNCTFFASQLVLEKDNWLVRKLHNATAFAIAHKLYLKGLNMMIIPMKV